MKFLSKPRPLSKVRTSLLTSESVLVEQASSRIGCNGMHDKFLNCQSLIPKQMTKGNIKRNTELNKSSDLFEFDQNMMDALVCYAKVNSTEEQFTKLYLT